MHIGPHIERQNGYTASFLKHDWITAGYCTRIRRHNRTRLYSIDNSLTFKGFFILGNDDVVTN